MSPTTRFNRHSLATLEIKINTDREVRGTRDINFKTDLENRAKHVFVFAIRRAGLTLAAS